MKTRAAGARRCLLLWSVVGALLAHAAVRAEEPSDAAAPTPAEFTVATFNMNWGNVDLDDTVEIIRRSGADVVCMQETNAASERRIRRRLARLYPHMEFRRGGAFSDGFAVLSKTPLARVRMIPARHGFFGTLVAETRLMGRRVQFASVHLEPVYPRNNEGFLGMIGVFLRTEEIHRREIAHIYSNLERDVPTVIAGDMNSVSFGSAPLFLAARGFTDSFASVTKDADRRVTWRWTYQGRKYRFRIDYVFHSADFVTLRSRIVPCESSDHHMVVSALAPAPAREAERAAAARVASQYRSGSGPPRRGATRPTPAAARGTTRRQSPYDRPCPAQAR